MFEIIWTFARLIAGLKRLLLPSIFRLRKAGLANVSIITQEDVEDYHDSLVQEIYNPISQKTEGFYFRKKKIVLLNDSILDLQSGIVFDLQKRIVSDSTPWSLEHLLLNHLPNKVIPSVLIPSVYGQEIKIRMPMIGFYHFLIEELPNLIRLTKRFPEAKLLSLSHPPNYVRDFACMLNLSLHPVKPLVKVSKLAYVTQDDSTGWPNYADIELVRSTFAKYMAPMLKGKKAYVSRRGSARSPKFEKALEDQLESKGWNVISAQGMGIKEQIEIFSSCEVIMGIHGAGLSNAIWLNQGSTLLEIRTPDWPHCFVRLAKVRDLKFDFCILDQDTYTESLEIPEQLKSFVDRHSHQSQY